MNYSFLLFFGVGNQIKDGIVLNLRELVHGYCHLRNNWQSVNCFQPFVPIYCTKTVETTANHVATGVIEPTFFFVCAFFFVEVILCGRSCLVNE
jgi:hypothetical protein